MLHNTSITCFLLEQTKHVMQQTSNISIATNKFESGHSRCVCVLVLVGV